MPAWRLALLILSLCGTAPCAGADPDTRSPSPSSSPMPATALSAASLYDAGNAYARSGKPGLAVLNYERARILAPADPDIAANLATVRSAALAADSPPSAAVKCLLLASPDAYAWFGLVGMVIAGIGLLGVQGMRRWRGAAAALALLGGLSVATTLANVVLWWPRLHAAVILTRDAPVRVAPVPMGSSMFTLREAELVRIEAEHQGFFLVRTSMGRTGWVAAADLARIVP